MRAHRELVMVHTLYRMFSPGTLHGPCEPLNQTSAVLMQSARARHDPPTARSTRFHVPCVGALSAPVFGLRLIENNNKNRKEKKKKSIKKQKKKEKKKTEEKKKKNITETRMTASVLKQYTNT